MADDIEMDLSPEQKSAGEAVARLSHPTPPEGLAARTLARVLEAAPKLRRPLLLRPITHPIARVLAAASIMLVLFPMTDVEMADPLGKHIEHRIVGAHVVDTVDSMLDRVLRPGQQGYTQNELDAVVGGPGYPRTQAPRKTPAKGAHAPQRRI